jgi:hypothetical protein
MTEPHHHELRLRPVDHPHAKDAYWVIWQGHQVGSIGLQQGAHQQTFWRWSLYDFGAPVRDFATDGDTISRDDAMAGFRQACDRFAADADRMQHMIEYKRDIAERSKHWGPRG